MPNRATDVAGIAGAVTALVCPALLFARVAGGGAVYWFGGWRPRAGSFPIGISFAVDDGGAALALFVLVLLTAALVYSWRYIEESHHLFEVLMLLFGGAMAGFALALRADERVGVRARGVQRRGVDRARGRVQLRGHEHHRRVPRPDGDRPRLRPHRRPQPREDPPTRSPTAATTGSSSSRSRSSSAGSS